MSILVDKNTRLIVQGITGNEGLFHTTQMVAYGTNVVGGVTPGKGGEWVLDGKLPVFDSVKTAKAATDANAAIIFVPARFAPDAMFEAPPPTVDRLAIALFNAPPPIFSPSFSLLFGQIFCWASLRPAE